MAARTEGAIDHDKRVRQHKKSLLVWKLRGKRMSKDEAKLEIDSLFLETRTKLSSYLKTYGDFYPGLFDGPPVVPRSELLTSCKVLPDRINIIERLPRGGRFAEVGTLFGDFIVKVVEINCPDEVHLFDLGFQNIRPANKVKLDCHRAVSYHAGDSSTQLSEIEDAFFDVVYVDGDHSYAGVWKDLSQALRVLKPRGYLICNDYTNWDPIQCEPYGVFSAVNRFANENNLSFEFLGLAAMGFHDIALRRMG